MTLDQTGKHSSMLYVPDQARGRLQLRLSERRLLLMLGDTIAVNLSVLIGLAIWAAKDFIPFDMDYILPNLGWFFVLTVLWFILASANDFYDLATAANRSQSVQKLVFITLQMLVVYLMVFFFSQREALPRLFILYYGVASFILVLLWRIVNPALIGWASSARHVLIIGTDWAAETIIDVLQHEAGDSYRVLGVISDQPIERETVGGIQVVGTGSQLMELIHRNEVREVIITSTRELSGETFQAVMDAHERGIIISPMPLVYERVTERVPVEHVGDAWAVVLPIDGNSAFSPYPILKRLFDVVISLIVMVPYLLILPFIALAIKLDSAGPVFYTQTRVGMNGRLFKIIKFRTMVQNAEQVTGAVFAQENDPRVTRVGKFLRKTRLDELPQLINVLKGDMSLIGPRPERPEHVARLQEKIPFYRTRNTIRPGVTGWAQVRYKYGANDLDALIKLQYDLYYIRHASILLDLTILIRTVRKVISMGGQ